MAPGERSDLTGPRPSRLATPTAPGTATVPSSQPRSLAARPYPPPSACQTLAEGLAPPSRPPPIPPARARTGRRTRAPGCARRPRRSPSRNPPASPALGDLLGSAQDLLDRRDREALEGRDGEVAVEVVAVSRVDAGAKPRARIGELDRRSPHSRDQLGDRPRLHRDPLLQPERPRSLEATALEPVVEQMVVVVSRHHARPFRRRSRTRARRRTVAPARAPPPGGGRAARPRRPAARPRRRRRPRPTGSREALGGGAGRCRHPTRGGGPRGSACARPHGRAWRGGTGGPWWTKLALRCRCP